MNIWLVTLAVFFFAYCSCAESKSLSLTENVSPNRESHGAYRIPFKFGSAGNSLATEQPSAVSEYRELNQSPYVVEFRSGPQPVAMQPPVIRPTNISSHVQEFGELNLDVAKLSWPANGETPAYPAHHRQINYAFVEAGAHQGSKKWYGAKNQVNVTTSMNVQNASKYSVQPHLVPVQPLAVYAASIR